MGCEYVVFAVLETGYSARDQKVVAGRPAGAWVFPMNRA